MKAVDDTQALWKSNSRLIQCPHCRMMLRIALMEAD